MSGGGGHKERIDVNAHCWLMLAPLRRPEHLQREEKAVVLVDLFRHLRMVVESRIDAATIPHPWSIHSRSCRH